MAAYLGYLLLAGVQSVFMHKKAKLGGRQFGVREYLMLCCAEIILLAGLRGYMVGADTKVYLDALEYYSSLPKNALLFAKLVRPFDFEPGYFLFTKLCAFINMPKTIFLFVVAAIIYIPVFYNIYRYSPMPYISILAYFALGIFAYSLGIFRQMMALSIVLCGLKYLEEGKLIPYLLIVMLAATFHVTALVMIAVYFLYHFHVERYAKWIALAQIVCLVFGRPIVLAATYVFPQYAHYLGGEYDVRGGTYLMLLFLNLVLYARVYLYRRGILKNRVDIAALSLGVVVQAIGYSMALFGRLVPYFSIFAIFSIPDILYALMYKPNLYRLVRRDVSTAWDKCSEVIANHKGIYRMVVWIVFVIGLMALILKNFVGNEYVVPYTFFFMQ